MASPAMAFSTTGVRITRRTGSLASMTIRPSARAWAAPPMSFFISRMPAEGLMSRPPVSNTTPLPTSATTGCEASPQVISIIRGARASTAARPTAWTAG